MTKRALFSVLCLAWTACSYSPNPKPLPLPKIPDLTLLDNPKSYGIPISDFKNLQYYVSPGFSLEREVSASREVTTMTHKLITRAGQLIEQIIVRNTTRGIAIDIGPDYEYFDIAFDPQDLKQTMRFERTASGYKIELKASQTILYEGNAYAYHGGDLATLFIGKEQLSDFQKKVRTLPGVVIR